MVPSVLQRQMLLVSPHAPCKEKKKDLFLFCLPLTLGYIWKDSKSNLCQRMEFARPELAFIFLL